MSLNKKFRTCIITFLLLTSIFSFISINNVKAQEPNEEDLFFYGLEMIKSMVDFDNVEHPHPYRFLSAWMANKTVTIEGDMTFDLYFSNPIFNQIELLDFQDNINLSVYHKDSIGQINQLKNGNAQLKLNPSFADDFIKGYQILLKDINQTIQEGEYLLFAIEIEQSEKPISGFIEKRFETKLKNRLEKIADILQKSDDDEIKEIGDTLEESIKFITENFSIGGEEIGKLVNVIFSSSFVYGSSTYSSSVKFKTTENENFSLYIQKEPEYYYTTELSEEFYYIKSINATKPENSTGYAWPPILIDLEDPESVDISEEDTLIWAMIWAAYTLETLPSSPENKITYYLQSNNVLNSVIPTGSEPIRDSLSKTTLKWEGSSFGRNKIIKNITANLYIYYPKILTLSKININASLKVGNTTIASDVKQIDRTNVIELLKKGPETPTMFTFNNFKEYELWYNKNITLEVTLASGPLFSIFRPVRINYNSEEYPSSVSFIIEDTERIQIEGIEDKLVYAGGSAHYQFNVTYENADDIDINIESLKQDGDWADFDFYPKTINSEEAGSTVVNLYVNSTAKDISAYDSDKIEFIVNASGKTGFDSNSSEVSVSEEAEGIHDIEIIAPDALEIKHGESKTYQFIVRNRNNGFIKDQYAVEAESEHNFTLKYDPNIGLNEIYIDIYTNENQVESIVNVTVTIPWYSEVTSDTLTLIITSGHSGEKYSETVSVTTKIITPNIFEQIYKQFESAAESIFGQSIPYAGWILIAGMLFIIAIIIIIILLIRRRKFVEMICLDRIKQITPDEIAEYEITVKNTYKYALSYNIKTEYNNENDKWLVELDTNSINLEPGKSQNVILKVKPTDKIEKEDWIEVKIIAKSTEKNKPGQISTVTTIINAETKIDISGVFHWPKTFIKGDRVETSFRLVNRGNVSAKNLKLFFYVNGKEKNKIENISIPSSGYADIEIPWIAVKGKNEIYIVVK